MLELESNLKIVFTIVYKEILQLTLIDELLEMIKFDFQQKVLPKLVFDGLSSVIMSLPQQQ